MVTNFNASPKTKVPACCSFDCCGNKFGRASTYTMKRTRRYAKRAERNQVRLFVRQEIESR